MSLEFSKILEKITRATSRGRIKLTFVTLSDIRSGAGTENVLLKLIQYCPCDTFEITVLQTDFMDAQRLTDDYVYEALKRVKVLTIKDMDQKFKFLFRNPVLLVFSRMLINPITSYILRMSKDRNKIREASASDYIYLFYNENYRLFKRSKARIIGSNHTSLVLENSIFSKIQFKLIQLGFLYRMIDSFHLFPAKSAITPNLGKKNNLVLTNGVETELFYPRPNRSPGKIKLLFAGRLEQCKGIGHVLQYWRNIEDKSGIELHIIGGGPESHSLSRIVDRNLIYHGVLDREKFAKVFGASDIFIYPTECDSLPIVVLEALSSGLYVIASDKLKGAFDECYNRGYLDYAPLEGQAFLNKITETVNKYRSGVRDEIERIRQHSFMESNYSWEVISKKFYDFLIEYRD